MSFTRRKALSSAAVAALLVAAVALPTAASAATPVTDPPEKMAALGDSITFGYAVTGELGSPVIDPSSSWSTGTNPVVNTQLLRIQSTFGTVVEGVNVSFPGVKADAIPAQAASVPADVTYSTLLIGGNDICGAADLSGMTSTASYAASVQAGVTELLAKNATAKVLLTSVPDITGLYEVGLTNPYAAGTHASNLVCPVALGTFSTETAEQAQARRDAVDARVIAYNESLEAIANTSPRVFYDNGAAFDVPFTAADLSTADYFHPGYTGQAKIASATWDQVVAQGVFDVAPAPVVAPKITVKAKDLLLTGNDRLKVTVTSDEAIDSVTMKVKGKDYAMVAGANNTWLSPANLKPSQLSDGIHLVKITAEDAGDDVSTKRLPVIIH